MAEATVSKVPAEFPASNFPNAFADGVSSSANSKTIVKFYLSRFEPDFHGTTESKMQPFAQVVMPMDGFLRTYIFFEQRVKKFIELGYFDENHIEEIRKTYVKAEADKKA